MKRNSEQDIIKRQLIEDEKKNKQKILQMKNKNTNLTRISLSFALTT